MLLYEENHLTDNQISRIQELIDNNAGDGSRLQHIKNILENGRIIHKLYSDLV